jgi:dolichol-phosphate mannosyltransferase
MKIAVIIPTYNERKNIQEIIPAVLGLNLDGLEIVVVDDNSPDKTWEIVEDIKTKDPRVHLIKRSGKLGLGTAYLEGFRHALQNGAEYVFEMDADFSHDHNHIPIFLQEIENHDLVSGSRYVKGGKTENWDLKRKAVSFWGNVYSKTILGVPFKDLTTGFKCYRREVIEHLVGKNIDSIGYVFQVETTYLAHKAGFRVKEIPIIFTERRNGFSKFNFPIIWESFWKVIELRLKK